MTRDQAAKLCDEINGKNSVYVVDIADVPDKHHPDYPHAVVIRHEDSKNEVGYSGQVSEIRYMMGNMFRDLPQS